MHPDDHLTMARHIHRERLEEARRTHRRGVDTGAHQVRWHGIHARDQGATPMPTAAAICIMRS